MRTHMRARTLGRWGPERSGGRQSNLCDTRKPECFPGLQIRDLRHFGLGALEFNRGRQRTKNYDTFFTSASHTLRAGCRRRVKSERQRAALRDVLPRAHAHESSASLCVLGTASAEAEELLGFVLFSPTLVFLALFFLALFFSTLFFFSLVL